MELFSISCTTCGTRLKVREEGAIGQILACPKCSSMVMVEPPPGWNGSGIATELSKQAEADDAKAEKQAKRSEVRLATPMQSTFEDAAALFSDQPPLDESPKQARSPAPDGGNGKPSPADKKNRSSSPTAKRSRPTAAKSPTEKERPRPQQAARDKSKAKKVERQQDDASADKKADKKEVQRRASRDESRPAKGKQKSKAKSPKATAENGVATSDLATQDDTPSKTIEGGGAEALSPAEDWSSPGARRVKQWLMYGVAAGSGLIFAFLLFGFIAFQFSGKKDQQAAAQSSDTGVNNSDSQQAPVASEDSAADSTASSSSTSSDSKDPIKESGQPTPPSVGDGGDQKDPGPVDPMPVQPEKSSDEGVDAPPGLTKKPDENLSGKPGSSLDGLGEFGKFFEDKPFDAGGGDSGEAVPPELAVLPEDVEASLPRPEPRDVDVEARLADPVPAIQFTGTTLGSFLQFVSEMSTIPITIEPEVLLQASVTTASKVDIQQSNTTVGAVLDTVLSSLGLRYVVMDGQLLISNSDPKGERPEVTYRVADLIASPEELSDVGEAIVGLIAPDSWEAAGGVGKLTLADKAWVVQQTPGVHFQVIVFCEQLRVARGLETRSGRPKEFFRLKTRSQRATEKLASAVTMNHVQPVRFIEILSQIERQTGVQLLVDWTAVADIGWNPDAEATLTVEKQSLAQTLSRLLDPMELSYRAVSEDLFQISTPKALAQHRELEFYNVSDLIKAPGDEAGLLQRIKAALDGSKIQSVADDFYFDRGSKCLIVAASQTAQIVIADELASARAK